MQGTQSTAAGATTANVLTGQLFERMPFDGYARFSLTGEAAGESRATIFCGGRVIMQESPLSRQARIPVIPDDIVAGPIPVRRGEQLAVVVRNTGAGANVIFWRVDLAPARR